MTTERGATNLLNAWQGRSSGPTMALLTDMGKAALDTPRVEPHRFFKTFEVGSLGVSAISRGMAEFSVGTLLVDVAEGGVRGHGVEVGSTFGHFAHASENLVDVESQRFSLNLDSGYMVVPQNLPTVVGQTDLGWFASNNSDKGHWSECVQISPHIGESEIVGYLVKVNRVIGTESPGNSFYHSGVFDAWIEGTGEPVIVSEPLKEALVDLEEAIREAELEGFPVPTSKAQGNARSILRAIFSLYQRRFEVYATPDGEIAIDALDGRGGSFLVLCASSGSVLCMVNSQDGHKRQRYDSADALPDIFVKDALAKMGQSRI